MIAAIARRIDGYVMAAAPASRLAAARLICGGFALIYLVARLPHFLGYAFFAPRQFRPVGVVALLSEPLPSWLVIAITAVTVVLAFGFFLGWRFRVVGPLFALVFMWTLTYRHSWGMVFHTDNLLALHIVVLGMTRSADAWSLDARRRRRATPAGAIEPDTLHGRYGWPLRVMCWVVVIAYVLAGVAKISNGGTEWIWGDELRNYVAIDNARKVLLGDIYSPLAAPLLHWDWLFKILALATVALELGAPVALLHVRTAAVWVVSVIGFHLGVLALMMIAFPYQMLGMSFVCFFAPERWLSSLETRIRRRWQQRYGPLEPEIDSSS